MAFDQTRQTTIRAAPSQNKDIVTTFGHFTLLNPMKSEMGHSKSCKKIISNWLRGIHCDFADSQRVHPGKWAAFKAPVDWWLDWVLLSYILWIIAVHYGTSCQPKKTCSYGYESKRGTRMVSYDSRLDVYSTFFPQIPGEMGLTYGPYVFINKTLEFYPIPGYPPVKKPLENQLLQLYQSKIIYIYGLHNNFITVT